MLGVMIDCSRNAVMNILSLKKLIDILHKIGYDTLMLYTEDTYEVDNEPYFGYMRGRYSKEELKEIDRYCLDNNIELIPCIQTLAHFNGIFQTTNIYSNIRDCDDILLVEEDQTYALLENIFSTIAECFTSRKIHIGMDEAGKVGLGKYLSKYGFKERFNIVNEHLHKVSYISDKYGFKPMIWSDMFLRLASGAESYWEDVNLEVIRKTADLPRNVTLVYWDYYSDDYNRYIKMFKTNKAFERPIVFAGGGWTWRGFMPDNGFAIRNTEVALKACKEECIYDVFTTLWGDDGGECSRYSALPTLLYTAELYRGNTEIESIKQKFYKLFGIAWDDFMLLDEFNMTLGKHDNNSYKYLFYNDPFIGLNDYRVTEYDNEYFSLLKEKLKKVETSSEFEFLFNTATKLCEVLKYKSQLGIKTRSAYLNNDKKTLLELINIDYEKTIDALEEFYKAYSYQWEIENKTFGFEIQDIRIGGLIWRLKHCQKRLKLFVEGKIINIPELEEKLLEGTGSVSWTNIVTPNVVSHISYGEL